MYGRHYACVHAVVYVKKLRNLEGSQLRNQGPLIPLLSQDVAPPWMCVSPPRTGGTRSRQQGIHCRAFIWTADGRPHPAVTRTLQYAADIASSRNGQQLSVKSFQRRWTHEIQITLQEGSHGTGSSAKSFGTGRVLLAGIIDRALHHWGHVSPLDGGNGDDDADTETDTAIPLIRGLQGVTTPWFCPR